MGQKIKFIFYYIVRSVECWQMKRKKIPCSVIIYNDMPATMETLPNGELFIDATKDDFFIAKEWDI